MTEGKDVNVNVELTMCFSCVDDAWAESEEDEAFVFECDWEEKSVSG